MNRVAEFAAPITDWDATTGDLFAEARGGLPAALAGLGLVLAGPVTVGLSVSGRLVTVRAVVAPMPEPEPPRPVPEPAAETRPARVRLSPVQRRDRARYLTDVNAKARAIRANNPDQPAWRAARLAERELATNYA